VGKGEDSKCRLVKGIGLRVAQKETLEEFVEDRKKALAKEPPRRGV